MSGVYIAFPLFRWMIRGYGREDSRHSHQTPHCFVHHVFFVLRAVVDAIGLAVWMSPEISLVEVQLPNHGTSLRSVPSMPFVATFHGSFLHPSKLGASPSSKWIRSV